MDPTCLVSTILAGGDSVNKVGNVFLAHFGLINTNQLSFESHSLSEYSCLQFAKVISNLFHEDDSEFSTPSIASNRTPLGCDGMGDSIMNVQMTHQQPCNKENRCRFPVLVLGS